MYELRTPYLYTYPKANKQAHDKIYNSRYLHQTPGVGAPQSIHGKRSVMLQLQLNETKQNTTCSHMPSYASAFQ